MRVLHVTPTFRPAIGGIETFVFNLCRYSQSELGIDPLVIDLRPGLRDFVREEYEGVPVVRSPVKHYFSVLQWPPDLGAYIADADLIHVHDFRMFGTAISMALQRRGKPMVLSTHGGFFHTKRHFRMKQLYYRTLLPAVLSRYDGIIADSASDFEMVRKLHRRVVRIDNPIDFDDFATVPLLTSDPPNFVYIGRFSRNKRLDRLFAALRALGDRGIQFRLLLVGPPSDETRDDLNRNLAASGIADKIELHFDVDQESLRRILAQSPYFVLASEYEGFGLVAVEAMAAARVVLLNRIRPLSDFVVDGRNGFLVDFANPEDAAKQIEMVMALDIEAKRKISAQARERAREFSWNARIHEYKKCYDLALARRSGSG
jgi:alpha-1,3-mannosyltransferase